MIIYINLVNRRSFLISNHNLLDDHFYNNIDRNKQIVRRINDYSTLKTIIRLIDALNFYFTVKSVFEPNGLTIHSFDNLQSMLTTYMRCYRRLKKIKSVSFHRIMSLNLALPSDSALST